MPNYPGSLDTLTNPTASNTLDSPAHATQHTDANDIVEALEAKVGTGASIPTTVGHVLTVTGAGATAYQAGGGGGGGGFIVSASDPGAVGAGVVWKDISVVGAYVWRERNDTDDGWFATFNPTVVAGGADDASARSFATTTGAGSANARPSAFAEGDGSAFAGAFVDAAGAGDASVLSQATANTGFAIAGTVAIRGVAEMGMRAEIDGTSARMAFNGTTPIAKPIVPLTTPDAQDVIDALVALGLISQSD